MVVRKRLGEMLLELGIIDESQLSAALGHQRKWGGRLGQALVDLKLATESQIVDALSRKFGYEAIKLEGLEASPLVEAALKLVPQEVATRHNVVPYAADTSTISVAMSDPGNIAVVDEIRFRTGRRVKVALAGDREIAAAVRRLYHAGEKEVEAIPLDLDEGASTETVVEQFGGGSTEALDRFFARPAPGPAPQAGGPAAAPGGSLSGAVELEDFLTPAPSQGEAVDAVAGAARPAAARPAAEVRDPGQSPEKTSTIELPLEAEVPPEGAISDPWSQGPLPASPGAVPAAAQPAASGTASPGAVPAAAQPAASGPPTTPAPFVTPAPVVTPAPAGRPAAAGPARTATATAPAGVPAPAGAAAPAAPRVPAGASAHAAPAGRAPAATRPPPREPSPAEREVELLGAIDQLVHGEPVPPELVRPSQLAAALVRLLIRKRLISFEEFLDEFGKK